MILTAIAMWALQLVLGLWQFRRVNAHVRKLRASCGRVAIGKAKGGFRSGAVVLICIDEENRILRAETMSGRTVFAGFHPLAGLEGKVLPALTEADCEGFGKQVKAAVLNARQDYENYRLMQKERSEDCAVVSGCRKGF
jgi:DNA-binding transcriptional regulator of glucitol operon